MKPSNVKTHVGKLGRGRAWTWASLEVGELQAWTIDQTGWKGGRRTVPALAARSILQGLLENNLGALAGGDEHGGVYVEHVLGGRGRLHWGRDSSGSFIIFS